MEVEKQEKQVSNQQILPVDFQIFEAKQKIAEILNTYEFGNWVNTKVLLEMAEITSGLHQKDILEYQKYQQQNK